MQRVTGADALTMYFEDELKVDTTMARVNTALFRRLDRARPCVNEKPALSGVTYRQIKNLHAEKPMECRAPAQNCPPYPWGDAALRRYISTLSHHALSFPFRFHNNKLVRADIHIARVMQDAGVFLRVPHRIERLNALQTCMRKIEMEGPRCVGFIYNR